MSLYKIRQKAPLIHCITNIVVANFQANGLLAIGASPVMADAYEEVAQMVAISNALSINMGTLNPLSLKAMIEAGMQANRLKIPVSFDPVGAGATNYRKDAFKKILSKVRVSAIRCNVGELAAIAQIPWEQKGVDSGEGDIDVVKVAKEVANKYSTIVAVTGKEDIVADQSSHCVIKGGSDLVAQITGSGCLLSAVVAATLASSDKSEWLDDIVATLQEYKKAGALAEQKTKLIGSFAVEFLNYLNKISKESK